ncbi:MAG: ATP-binding protein [Gammaproteobacteria bacterium]|nr:ATP-binding protein [Gammaproteobacteria bacterium]
MDELKNPYAPNAGRPPPVLAGRTSLLEGATVSLKRTRIGRHANSILFIGLRGVGKTVLLKRIAKDAQADGIACLRLEARENFSLPAMLAPKLEKALIELAPREKAGDSGRKAWTTLANFARSMEITYGDIGVRFRTAHEAGIADTGDLEIGLSDLLAAAGGAAAEKETSVAIFIDELQYVEKSQLAALIAALHTCEQDQLPVTVIGAGLPQLVGQVGKAKTYAERLFDFSEIGKLPDKEARYAIQKPAEREGASFEPAALEEILSQTQCYPYFLQEWGSQSWLAAKGKTITLADVRTAADRAQAKLDTGFFRVRYDRCTPAERKYLRAMAELGPGPHKSGDIAALMGRSIQSVSPHRDNLISKGMIYNPQHGDTAFTVPLFDKFMKRTMPFEP